MHDLYSSQAFEEKYTYTGCDLGAIWSHNQTVFRVWAPTAETVTLNLYRSGTPGTEDLLCQMHMYPAKNGTWTAQVDDFTNGYPNQDYAEYVIGTNGSLFGPMGGLRISVNELCQIMLMFCNGGSHNGAQILKPETVERMFTPVWTYDPELENGDTYWGLMTCYGAGPHIFTNTDMGDRMIIGQDLPFAGHTAEAYGLLGGMGFDRETGNGIIYIVAGTGCDPSDYYGEYSAFYGWEEALLTAGLTYADFDY